jgi:flagellar biosynthesis protein FlhG
VSLSIAITSAKGGTGASTLARNMAVFLAQVGRATALVDLSGSLSNVEAFARLDEHEIASDGPAYLRIRPGLQNLEVFLAKGEREGLWEEMRSRLSRSEIEALVMDVRFDGSPFVSRVLRSSPLRLIVARPEPTSVWELYACASRLVEDAIGQELEEGIEAVRSAASSEDWLAGFLSPRDIMEIAGPGPIYDKALERLRSMRVGFVLNMAQERDDFELGRAIESVGARVFCLPLVDMGTVESDNAITTALRSRVPLLMHMPYSKAGRDLEALVRRLLSAADVDHVRPRLEVRPPHEQESLYEALEVDRGAGEHEIRKALKRIQEIFRGSTLATVELRRAEAVVGILDRAAEAHRTLLDRKLRREYDRKLIEREGASSYFTRPFGERPAKPVAVRPLPAHDAPPEPVPEEGVSGGWLASMRALRGVTIDELSSISKVSVTYLRAIEEESFSELPEPVYVRGFLMAYARTLNLDAEAVARSYLELMEATG